MVKPYRPFRRSRHELMNQRIGALPDLIGRALCGNAAIGQNDDLVSDVEGFIQIVRHDDAGQPQGIVQLTDQARGRAQSVRRLLSAAWISASIME